MHELSIVEALVKQCEKYAKANKATKILKIEVKIGVLSGIEPHFLQNTYEVFKQGTICEDAILQMQIQPIKVQCEECKSQNELSEYVFLCPKCQSNKLSIIDGEDMLLMHLECE